MTLASLSFGQPGPFGGSLTFRIFDENGVLITPSRTEFTVTAENINDGDNFSYSKSYFLMTPNKTPVGSFVSKNFHIRIIYYVDTMLIYTPNFGDVHINFDSITFQSGTFNIPDHIYNFDNSNLFLNGNTRPNIKADWVFFKSTTPTVFIELIEELTPPKEWDEFSKKYFKTFLKPIKIKYPTKETFYLSNIIIVKDSIEYFTVYQIKDIVENTLFSDSKVYEFKVDTIYYENNFLYAIGFRDFGIGGTVRTIYGKFKLYYDHSLSEDKITCLEYKFHKDIMLYVKEKLDVGSSWQLFMNAYTHLFNEFKIKKPKITKCE